MNAPEPRNTQGTFRAQLILVGVLLPLAFYFLLRGNGPGGVPCLMVGSVLLVAAVVAGWSIWSAP